MFKVLLMFGVLVGGQWVQLAPPQEMPSIEVCLDAAHKFLDGGKDALSNDEGNPTELGVECDVVLLPNPA
jgi:hypothetical protein